MLMPLEAEAGTFHASAAAFLRPQSSALRDHQHRAGQGRGRLFDSERFKRKFVTTLADLRRELGLRIVGYVLIRQLTDCHLLLWPSDGANPTQVMQPACGAGPAVVGPPILMADGSSSGAGSCRAAVALTFRSTGRVPAKNADLKVGATLAWPRRQELGTGYREEGKQSKI
jgi:hypothetical protein